MNRPSERSAIDDAIDRVAADATDGEPSPEFRARVMARLGERRPSYAWPLLAAAATAAVVIVAALMAIRAPQRTAPVEERVAVASPAVESGATSPAPLETPTVASITTVHAELASFALPAIALPPLEAIEPITLESIQPTKLSIPQLTVEPIVMPALDDNGSIRAPR
ncbi:MAG TPA: hypothetical protein VJN96_05385 [Vicinamibacterales bacterium]|nr:hypothetical protein [Vicinamibacterales bacterium]